MSMDWVTHQIRTMSANKRQTVVQFNPRPPGVMRGEGATTAVLEFLKARCGQFFTHKQITTSVARSAKSVDWALLYLRAQKLVESVPDSSRNPRYLRYRAVKE